MGIVVACVIVAFIVVSAGQLALWVMSTRRQDARLAQLEGQSRQFGKQQAVDSFCFAHQARIHGRKLSELDERVMYMAREIRATNAYADTVSMVAVVDPDKATVRPPAP